MDNRGMAPIKVLALIALVVGGMWYLGIFEGGATKTQKITEKQIIKEGQKEVPESEIINKCGDDYEGTLKIKNINPLNTSGAEYTSASYHVYQTQENSDGWTHIASGTTNANDTYVTETLDCGYGYKVEYTAGATQASKIIKAESADGVELTDQDAVAIPKMMTNNLRITTYSPEKGSLQFKLYDEQYNQRYASDGSTDWETDPATFISTDYTNSTTYSNISVGTGESLDGILKIRTSTFDQAFDDYNAILALDGDISTWNFDQGGYTFSESKVVDQNADINTDETAQLDGYQKYIEFDSSIAKSPKEELTFTIPAASGIDPATGDTVDMSFMLRGKYTSNQVNTLNEIKVSGAEDDTSHSAVYTIEDVTFQVA